MSDINNLATFLEISKTLGVSRQAVVKRFENEGWQYSEKKAPRGHVKEFALGDLPKGIREKISLTRINAILRLDDQTRALIDAKNQPAVLVVVEKKHACAVQPEAPMILDDT